MSHFMLIFTEIASAIWVICSALAYGFLFAYFQKKYLRLAKEDYWKDRLNSFYLSCFGPLSLLIIIYLNIHKYGFKFR